VPQTLSAAHNICALLLYMKVFVAATRYCSARDLYVHTGEAQWGHHQFGVYATWARLLLLRDTAVHVIYMYIQGSPVVLIDQHFFESCATWARFDRDIIIYIRTGEPMWCWYPYTHRGSPVVLIDHHQFESDETWARFERDTNVYRWRTIKDLMEFEVFACVGVSECQPMRERDTHFVWQGHQMSADVVQ